MIAETTLREITQKYQIDDGTVLREYFQNLFLSYFYQHEQTDRIYFKGGAALRLIYRSPRFSEDIDFSAGLTNVGPIESAVIDTLNMISKEGVATDIEEATPTTGGYIANIRFTAYGHTILLRLEVSLRRGKRVGALATVTSDFLPDYTVLQLEESQLVGEKIAALLTRKKPRDFYDFYFLLRHNMISKTRETFEAVLTALNESNIRFDSELRKFLPKSHQLIIRDFKATLEREIKRYL